MSRRAARHFGCANRRVGMLALRDLAVAHCMRLQLANGHVVNYDENRERSARLGRPPI